MSLAGPQRHLILSYFESASAPKNSSSLHAISLELFSEYYRNASTTVFMAEEDDGDSEDVISNSGSEIFLDKSKPEKNPDSEL